MNKPTEEVVEYALCRVRGPFWDQKHVYLEQNAWESKAIVRTYGQNAVALACLDLVARLDRENRIGILAEWRRGNPGMIISDIVKRSYRSIQTEIDIKISSHLPHLSSTNEVFLERMRGMNGEKEVAGFARALRTAYRRSDAVMYPLFAIVAEKATRDTLPVLKTLRKDMENDRAFSAKADTRRAFAEQNRAKLDTLISDLETISLEGSLFETLPTRQHSS